MVHNANKLKKTMLKNINITISQKFDRWPNLYLMSAKIKQIKDAVFNYKCFRVIVYYFEGLWCYMKKKLFSFLGGQNFGKQLILWL